MVRTRGRNRNKNQEGPKFTAKTMKQNKCVRHLSARNPDIELEEIICCVSKPENYKLWQLFRNKDLPNAYFAFYYHNVSHCFFFDRVYNIQIRVQILRGNVCSKNQTFQHKPDFASRVKLSELFEPGFNRGFMKLSSQGETESFYCVLRLDMI